MTQEDKPLYTDNDARILKNLAGRLADIAHSPLMQKRVQAWKDLNGLRGGKPMIITECFPAFTEIQYTCEGEWARTMEGAMRTKLFQHEYVGDDIIIEPVLKLNPGVTSTGYGVESTKHHGNDGAGHGSMRWDPPLKDLPGDLKKLHVRQFSANKQDWRIECERLNALIGDVLPVIPVPWLWWTHGLTIVAIDLIGLEPFMFMMYDNPEGLHALMAFLRDDHMNALDWHEQNGLLSPSTGMDYYGSGGCGCTDELPAPGYVPGQPARLKDMWGLSESQETVSVSPEMFEEFVFPYQLPVIERFGLSYYGCCEPVDQRWHIIKRIPNLRAVSVSPWSDVEKMAENLGKRYVFCRKPNPAYVSSEWNEAVIRQDIRRTVEATKGLNVQFVLKDVHTVNNEPDRFPRWVKIVREEIDRVYEP